ncbi:hypothetical protein [uncultured Winogradskyella sp.]|uniref:hypothetical protein n=1 Tax=uncultured Winogradskyella sp. TaxID=395353 RepID=UPI00262E9940|nr:hypothetical protein [uncultured Winogradskyella sp.]
MFKKLVFIVVILCISFKGLAQKDINNYKYVVVPLQFDFLKGKDKYRTSTLLRHLFKNEGFMVYFDEENLPEDLFKDRCLGIYANLVKVPGVFKSKVQIELKDCYGELIFLSDVGQTKIKEYSKAYPEVIKQAFKSIAFLNYKYDASSKVALEKESEIQTKLENIKESNKEAEKAKAEVEKLKKEVEDLKRQKEEALKKAEIEKAKVEEEAIKKAEVEKANNSSAFLAKITQNGYQLVNANSEEIEMELFKTAAPNVYTVKGKNAIVFKEGDKWFYSENDTKKELNIKF